ncbi:MAG: NAD(P)H-dependent oxidoreductase [Dehalococcoidales bacterium]|nr:NAD(P)H-dependent oxidoreductase [Dehalococcoidales bacterium]
MKNICFINGSLRGKEASSLAFLKAIDRRLGKDGYNREYVTVRARTEKDYPAETMQKIARADTLVLVFPLFSYGFPGALMRLLEDYYRYTQTGGEYKKGAGVYAVINCGFPRPEITGEAVRLVQAFCRKLELNWRFSVCIGSGPVAVVTGKVPLLGWKLNRAFAAIASDIRNGGVKGKKDILVRPVIPEFIILRIKARYEKKMMQTAAARG